MIDDTTQATNKAAQSFAEELPDLWEDATQTQKPTTHTVRVFPLDTTHEISAVPAPDGILSPAGDPNALPIAAHVDQSEPDAAEILLQEEIKVDATQAKSLWNHIRDFLALNWWEVASNT
jgi:hypothetical protein